MLTIYFYRNPQKTLLLKPLQLREKPLLKLHQLRPKPKPHPPTAATLPPMVEMLAQVVMPVAMPVPAESEESHHSYSLEHKITKRQFFTECDSN